MLLSVRAVLQAVCRRSVIAETWIRPYATPCEICGGQSGTATRFQARSQDCEKRLLASSHLSACLSAWNNSVPTARIFGKLDIWGFFENPSRKSKFHLMFEIVLRVVFFMNGPGSSVGIATELRAGRSGDRIPVGRDFPPVQTDPGAHPASCVQWVPSLSRGVKYGRGVLLTTHPLLVPRSWKSRAIPLPTVSATTGPVGETLFIFLEQWNLIPVAKNSTLEILQFI